MMKLQIKEKNKGIVGKYLITKYSQSGAVLRQIGGNNLVVSSDGYGRNQIARHFAGNSSDSLAITKMSLSTNGTAPVVSDTSLGGTTVDVDVQTISVSTGGEANVVSISAFFTDGELPNGTYQKIGLKMGTILLTSALLDTPEVKDTGEQYRVDYELIIN